MTDGSVLLSSDSGVATLRLNRPDAGNALDLQTAREFRDRVGQIAVMDGLHAVVLSSAGKLFCAGGDVAAMSAAGDRSAFVFELASTIHEGLEALRELPVPIVAGIQGAAAGAGVGLVLAADIAIASERSKFVSAYGDVGLTPDCGVSALLANAIGIRRATRFLLTGLSLGADEALEWGLVSDVCPADELETRVSDVVASLRSRPGAVLGESARLLRRASEQSYAEHLRAEAETIARMSSTPEATERLARFVSSKRTASTGGR